MEQQRQGGQSGGVIGMGFADGVFATPRPVSSTVRQLPDRPAVARRRRGIRGWQRIEDASRPGTPIGYQGPRETGVRRPPTRLVLHEDGEARERGRDLGMPVAETVRWPRDQSARLRSPQRSARPHTCGRLPRPAGRVRPGGVLVPPLRLGNDQRIGRPDPPHTPSIGRAANRAEDQIPNGAGTALHTDLRTARGTWPEIAPEPVGKGTIVRIEFRQMADSGQETYCLRPLRLPAREPRCQPITPGAVPGVAVAAFRLDPGDVVLDHRVTPAEQRPIRADLVKPRQSGGAFGSGIIRLSPFSTTWRIPVSLTSSNHRQAGRLPPPR